jgi:hypothetical protein
MAVRSIWYSAEPKREALFAKVLVTSMVLEGKMIFIFSSPFV